LIIPDNSLTVGTGTHFGVALQGVRAKVMAVPHTVAESVDVVVRLVTTP